MSGENYGYEKIDAGDYKLENYRLKIRINVVCSVYRISRIMYNCNIKTAMRRATILPRGVIVPPRSRKPDELLFEMIREQFAARF